MDSINHLRLSTGRLTRIDRADVSGQAIALVAPWLSAAVQAGTGMELPGAVLKGHHGMATAIGGALAVTIMAKRPTGPDHRKPALMTLGVAIDSKAGEGLWPSFSKGIPGAVVAPGLNKPAEPWCAVATWPGLSLHPEVAAWLAQFERQIAWAWLAAMVTQQHTSHAGVG